MSFSHQFDLTFAFQLRAKQFFRIVLSRCVVGYSCTNTYRVNTLLQSLRRTFQLMHFRSVPARDVVVAVQLIQRFGVNQQHFRIADSGISFTGDVFGLCLIVCIGGAHKFHHPDAGRQIVVVGATVEERLKSAVFHFGSVTQGPKHAAVCH